MRGTPPTDQEVSARMSNTCIDAVPHQLRISGDSAIVAHAALVVTGRSEDPSVTRAADYLCKVADVIGVDCIKLAGLIVQSSEQRASTGRTEPAA